jgi:hypothetical protein
MRLFPATADANARRLVAARGLRALADGYVSILLPAYLLALGGNRDCSCSPYGDLTAGAGILPA